MTRTSFLGSIAFLLSMFCSAALAQSAATGETQQAYLPKELIEVRLKPPLDMPLRLTTVEERNHSSGKIKLTVERDIRISRLGRGYAVQMTVKSAETEGPAGLVELMVAGYRIFEGRSFEFLLTEGGELTLPDDGTAYWDALGKGIDAMLVKIDQQDIPEDRLKRLQQMLQIMANLPPEDKAALALDQIGAAFRFPAINVRLGDVYEHKAQFGNAFGVDLPKGTKLSVISANSQHVTLREQMEAVDKSITIDTTHIVSRDTGLLVSSQKTTTTRTDASVQKAVVTNHLTRAK